MSKTYNDKKFPASYIAEFASTTYAEQEEDLYLENLAQEEIDESDYQHQLLLATLDNIRRAVAQRIISEEEGEQYKVQAMAEYTARVAAILDVELGEDDYEDDEDDEAGFSRSSSGYANFSSGTEFGQAVLELATEEYEDPIEGLIELADHVGISDEDLLGLVQGVYAPDQVLTEQIADFFDTTSSDEDAYLGLLILGGQAEELASQYADDEDEGEDDEDDAEYAYSNSKIAALDQRIAEFEAYSAVSTSLAELDAEAARGVSEGWLPPAARRLLMGTMSPEKRVAEFSAICNESEVDPATHLFGIQYALNVFESCGPLIRFGAYAEEPLTEEEFNQEKLTEQQARLNFQLMKEG